jgi:hypothetical protein
MIHLFFSIFQTIIKIILKHSIKNTKEKHDVFVSFLTPMHQLTWVTQWIRIIFEGVSFQSYVFLCWHLGTLAAPLALLRAEIVLKRGVCSAPPPLSSKKRRPNFGGSAKDTQVNCF